MGKRSDFKRVEKDYYRTWDYRAVMPLLPHLKPFTAFAEPCAGDGSLTKQLTSRGHINIWESDIEPKANEIIQSDALTLTYQLSLGDCIITNPPWSRNKKSGYLLHKMIEHFRLQNDTWLLFDADWMFTKQSKELMKYCHKIIAVGRIKWIEGSKYDGKDNCCWYLFKKELADNTVFIGR